MSNPDGTSQSLKITFDNEATIYQAESLWQKLASQIHNDQPLALDLSDVDEFDTSCVQILLYTKQQRDKLGFSTLIEKPSPTVLGTFETLGISTWFDVKGDA